MDAIEAACIIYIYNKSRFRKRKKRFWIHPLLEERRQKGLFRDIRKYEDKFFGYVRMSVKSFDELLVRLKDSLKGTDTHLRLCITPEERLLITLRYLASGCNMVDLHYIFRIGVTTIAEMTREVCYALWIHLHDICLPSPETEQWKNIAKQFQSRADFPNCIGAIDGKHIRIVKPLHSGSMFYNYKHYCSIILLAVCDADYKFTVIDVGAYGKFSDSSIFQSATFYQKLKNETFNVPEPASISTTKNAPLPFVLVGDKAFALSKFLMKPYSKRSLTTKKRIFNYRLSRARRNVECTFGILANKWRIFHRPLNVNVDFARCIIKACCILHNYVRDRDGVNVDLDTLTCPLEGISEEEDGRRARRNRSAQSYRDQFADYFAGEGQLTWQLNYI